ncbi:hypothetical protein MES5069_530039 [Mesorhizobium escarrei]|uniref:Uncharacterized protein n=1 Tax=Mesorhizobium escarrei TaxID=666018 RepID=A0ABM9EBC3_9HYPH|nr:hypothetical protein MES5069_530039 [Mesorhizobium escarrei]
MKLAALRLCYGTQVGIVVDAHARRQMRHAGVLADLERRRHRRGIDVDDQGDGFDAGGRLGRVDIDVDGHDGGILRPLRRLDPDDAAIDQNCPIAEHVAFQILPDPVRRRGCLLGVGGSGGTNERADGHDNRGKYSCERQAELPAPVGVVLHFDASTNVREVVPRPMSRIDP